MRYKQFKKDYNKNNNFKIWDLSTIRDPDDFYISNVNKKSYENSKISRKLSSRQKGETSNFKTMS